MRDERAAEIRVECTECSFLRIVGRTSDELPADAVRDHGARTGHTLRVSSLDDER